MRLGYVHLPRFGIQRKVTQTPSLGGKPLALIEELGGVQRVVSASSAALRAGVQPGMTLSAGRARIPSLLVFQSEPEECAQALMGLGEILLSVVPAFELSPPDGFWVDASSAALWKGEQGLVDQLLRGCHAQGFLAQVSLASERFTARALARHGTRRGQVVPHGQSIFALGSLPLLALEGRESMLREVLGKLGFKRLGELAALPVAAVTARFGALGVSAHRQARGDDDSRLVPTVLPEEIEERVTLESPVEALEPLLFVLKGALHRLGMRLQGRQRAVVRIGVSLFTEARRAGEKSEVHVTLARPTAQSKVLLDLLRPALESLRLPAPVEALRVLAEQTCEDRAQQRVLGDGPQGEAALEVVLARLATALGAPSLGAARLEEAHRPETAYSIVPFQLPRVAEGLLGELEPPREPVPVAAKDASAEPEVSTERPARLLPSPTPLETEVDGQGRPTHLQLWGKRRRVTRVSGPERLAGEWWGASRYRRDYYRVSCEGVGAVWLFKDADDGRYYLQGLFD